VSELIVNGLLHDKQQHLKASGAWVEPKTCCITLAKKRILSIHLEIIACHKRRDVWGSQSEIYDR